MERLGTGTIDMNRLSVASNLHEPEFITNEEFKGVLWRPATGQVTDQVDDQVDDRGSSGEVERVVLVLEGEMKRTEIQGVLELKHEDHFRDNYLIPAMEAGLVEMTIPGKPNSSRQQYRLTSKGQALKQKLEEEK
ncbi:MAG: Fic family protein [Aquaticitalea sp.]